MKKVVMLEGYSPALPLSYPRREGRLVLEVQHNWSDQPAYLLEVPADFWEKAAPCITGGVPDYFVRELGESKWKGLTTSPERAYFGEY